MSDDLISRQAAIDALEGIKPRDPFDRYEKQNIGIDWAIDVLKALPSAQTEDWMERNKERILQAGMEGREIEFRIGGRLFAIREKAQ